MSFEEFTKKILEKFDISFDAMKMHYTLKFNPGVIQDLEDEDDLDNVVSHSDDLQIGSSATFPSFNASCDAIPNTMMLSRGFVSRYADNEYTPLESIRFCQAILRLGHTFKNVEEFRNAIYQMSLGGSGPYKGALLSAIAYDTDDEMFPLALGVGILRSVFKLFGTGNHAYCYRHVKKNFSNFLNKQNIRGKKRKEDALLLLDSIAYARLDINYEEAFEKLVHFNDNLAKWVAENNPEHWAMSKFLQKR
ncbi:hypothetical protein CK203_045401 [Vitis vinifera]|uniref:Uncharacterized protein n=1 Tax=Vitis vinifera TaxID=29760 RepID=A0A438H928_VITVI|nr:hypothetical protein CK203_045401 [Vitis vinifera]